jgi:hypothetical protein
VDSALLGNSRVPSTRRNQAQVAVSHVFERARGRSDITRRLGPYEDKSEAFERGRWARIHAVILARPPRT